MLAKKIVLLTAVICTLIVAFSFAPMANKDAIYDKYNEVGNAATYFAISNKAVTIEEKIKIFEETASLPGNQILLSYPVQATGSEKSYITSKIGPRKVTGGSSWHAGTDIIMDGIADPTVISASEGVVVIKKYQGPQKNGNAGAGNYVVIRTITPNGVPLLFKYMHLKNESDLVVGNKVKVGDKVGVMGATGRAGMGVHLHFEVQIEDNKIIVAESIDVTGKEKSILDPFNTSYFVYAKESIPQGGVYMRDSDTKIELKTN